jgi:acetyl-CoA carboxylase biotin carboxyl carrier protein
MDMQSIKRLIELADTSGLDEIEIKGAAGGIRISRTPRCMTTPPLHHIRGGAPAAKPRSAARSGLQAHGTIAALYPDEHVITAPTVGTFYGAPVPGAAPFVRVGDAIARGQVLCVIDAMKLIYEVQSDRPGRVTWIMAKSGDAVRLAQPLFLLQ